MPNVPPVIGVVTQSGVSQRRSIPGITPPTQCSIWLEDDPSQKLLFESFPDKISEGYGVSWNFDIGRGRASQSVYAYYNGGDYHQIPFELYFYVGTFSKIPSGKDNSSKEAQLIELEKKARWCQALGFPRPKNRRGPEARKTSIGDPPKFIISIGRFLQIRGVTTGVTLTYNPPFSPISTRPSYIEVSFQVQRIGIDYIDWYDAVEVVESQVSSVLELPKNKPASVIDTTGSQPLF